MADIGKSISESVSLISKVGAECELLATLVKQELSSLLGSVPVSKRFPAGGGWIEHWKTDDHGWVYVDYANSLPLIIKPKRSIGAYLVFQISLAGDRIAAAGNDQPLMHVGFCWGAVDFEEFWIGFPMDMEEPAPYLEEGTLFRWQASGKDFTWWTYSLRLAEINNVQDVRKMIVEPVKALLLGESASDALPQALRGVVRYCPVEDEPGQYRVVQ